MTAVLVVVALALVIALVAAIVLLGLPLVATVRERLRVDLERRMAELQLQRITSEAMLRMLKENRRP